MEMDKNIVLYGHLDMCEARIYCLSDEFRMAMKDLLSAVQVDRPPQMQLCLQSQMVAILGKVLKNGPPF